MVYLVGVPCIFYRFIKRRLQLTKSGRLATGNWQLSGNWQLFPIICPLIGAGRVRGTAGSCSNSWQLVAFQPTQLDCYCLSSFASLSLHFGLLFYFLIELLLLTWPAAVHLSKEFCTCKKKGKETGERGLTIGY